MESDTTERIFTVERRLSVLETDVAVIRDRSATNEALAELRGQVEARFNKVDGEISVLRTEMNSRFAALELKIDAEIAKVRGEISQMGMTILRWMTVTQLVTIGAVGGLIKYLH
jgi:hypothetical protein